MNELADCNWPGEDALMRAYHDGEWGIPLDNDRKLFEFRYWMLFRRG